ncbi:PREDICTED: titin-like isoform X2 [Branchiostoma belcheri]|uniref:Titin-like isoform X2 n=1 Tax=Branchiostoma belcheri TaxID=7741 RepID=A0A6P4YBS8_BRABE|nr:PREDICTED: titin-like isoform X2 [Branchiostoma belcheri]
MVGQDRYKALTRTVPSMQAVKLNTAEEKEVKTPLEEVKGVPTNTTYTKPSYNMVGQDRYKALTRMVPSMQAVKLDTAQEKEVKTSLDEVQGLVPKIAYSTPCYHTVRQDRYKAYSNLVPSAEAPSIKLNKGKEQKAHLRLVMKGGDLAPISWHKAAVAAVTQEYVKAKYSQVPSNQPIHIAKIQSAISDLESIETHVEIAWNTVKPVSTNHQYSKAKFSFTKSNSPVFFADTQTAETKLEKSKVQADLDWVKPELIPVAPHYYKTKSRSAKSQDPLYSGIQESMITVPQSVDDLAPIQKEKANVVDVSHKYEKAKSSQVSSNLPLHNAKLGSTDAVAESVNDEVKTAQYSKPEYEKVQQVVLKHNTNVVASNTAQYQQGNQKTLHLAEDEVEGIIEPFRARGCKFETVPQPYDEAVKYEITPSQKPTYQAKSQDLILKTEVVKENTDKVEFHKPAVELTGQTLFSHDTAITKSGQPSYHQAKKSHLILTTEVAKESTDEVDFHKPTVAHTDQKLLSHDTAVTKSGKPTYHEAKKNHSILTTEYTKEITDRVEFHKAAVELSVVKLFRHNTAITKSKWRYFGVREGRITLQTEGVHGLDTNVKYETANVRKVEQELHTANKDEVLVETADYFHTKPHRAAVPPLETLGVVEPLTYETASVQNVEAVFAKADQGEVTVEAPEYHTAITNSKFLTLSETKEDVTEIKYDTVTPQTVSEEPLHNVIVGEGKSEWHWLHAEEGELEELTFEKTRKLKPPIIESAVREIVDPQLEMPRPVFITNQAAVQAPLPTFTAKEVNSLPEWETCETFTVEEVTPVRAKASVAVMNVCRAQASQPRVQLAEEMPIVKVDAVQALSPPPKTRPGLFYVKPKEVQQPPLEEVGTIDDLNTESAKVSEEETPTLHKVTVTPVSKLKLELPKLEIREEEETITVDDLDLSPVTVVSPKPTQIHAKIEMEEQTEVPSQMHVSLPVLPRPLLKQANEDSLEEIPLGSTLEIPELPYHKARTSMCPLLTSHRAGAMKLPIQRAPLGYNQDWRTLKRLEGLRASLMVNGETEAPYISRTSSVQSLNSQMSNDLAWTYADDKKPTEKEEKKEPSASPEKPSPPRPGSRKPLDDNTFKAPEEEPDAPVPPKDEPKAAPPKKGTAIQMVRELLGLPPKGKTQPEAKPAAPVTKETPPEPVVKETPAPEPVVKETPAPEPVIKETPAPEPVVKETPPETVVKERPAPVVSRAPKPVVKEMPAPEPLVKEMPAPEPVVKEMPAPEPVVKETPAPEPVVKETPAPEPVVKETPAPEPVVKETSAPVKKAPEPITIGPPSAELPEPVDLPTTPIPSSMVVPSGPQKSPPAASAQPEAAAASSSPLGEVSLTFLVPTSSGIKIIKTS